MYRRYIDLSEVNDSMELDSETIIAELREGDVTVSLEVHGDIRVIFDGQVYRYPSEFPDELMEMIHNGSYDTNDRVEVGANNWFELFVDNGNCNEEAELVDCEGYTPDQVAELLIDTYIEYIKRVSLENEKRLGQN